MLLLFVIIALFIYLFVEIFHYFKVKANAFSKEELIKAAGKQARHLEYKDPEITCDYCGCKVDTRVHKVCPHCGGPYDKDTEWTDRHAVEEAFVERETNSLIAQREKKAAAESQEILNKIKRTIYIIAGINALMIVLFAFSVNRTANSRFRGNEDVNGKYDNFVEADYTLTSDGTLFDNGDITITLEGFYLSERSYDSDGFNHGNVKAAIHVVNNLDEEIKVNIVCNAINGYADESGYIFTYDTFKKHSDVTFYEEMYRIPDQIISEMIISKVAITNSDYTLNESNDAPIILTTTATSSYTPDFSDGTLIFSNDKADVYVRYKEGEYSYGYEFYIENKTDKYYVISSSEILVDGKMIGTYGFTKSPLPAGYIFQSSPIHSYNEEFKELRDKNATVTIAFSCKEDPSYDFSTGFLNVNQ